MVKKENKTIEIELKKLEEIARYYEFPFAIFFTPNNFFKKNKTRLKELMKKAEKYDKIREIILGDLNEEN